MSTERPDGPATQRIAMEIKAGTVPFQPGMDPANPLHVLHIKFGPLVAEFMIPESNVETFIEAASSALRRQVEASRAERLGVEQPGLIVPDGMPADPLRAPGYPAAGPLGAMPTLAAMRERRQ